MMKQRRDSGYSLVEVLIALAITSVVLLTVVTLFYMGRRNVYSGKQMTYAVSVGTRVLEDLSSMSQADVLNNFNIDDSTTQSNVTVQDITYASSTTRDTSACTTMNPTPPPTFTCSNDPFKYMAAWKDLIDVSKLANAKVGLIFTPRGAQIANEPWTDSQFLKVRAYIQWDEAQNRRRIAFFDTTKVYRH